MFVERRVPGRASEVLALSVGLASAAVLAAVAASSLSDPEALGRAALQRLAAEVAGGVVAEWEGVRALGWSEPDVRWRTGARASAAPATPRNVGRSADRRGADLVDALLEESEREELVLGDPARALATASAALEVAEDPLASARVRLRLLELWSATGDCAAARAAWSDLEEGLRGDEARGGVSCRLLALLAVARCLEPEERVRARDAEVQRWRAGELALPGGATVARDTRGGLEVRVAPRLAALAEALDALGPGEPVAAELDALRLAALEAELGALPGLAGAAGARGGGSGDAGAAWLFVDGDVVALRAPEPSARELHLLRRDELEERLSAALERLGEAASGFSLDFDGRGDGAVVRPRAELEGGAFGFALRHADPEAVVAREGRRIGWLRAALLALAAFAAVAGGATFRALRRERHLARLRSAFVTGVSHELRTPLASILLMAENLEGGRVTPDARARYHASLRREAERLRRLVDDVLDFSRIERGEAPRLAPEEIALARWWDELARAADELAERRGGRLTVEARDLPPVLEADGDALRRAVLNLVDNALRHGVAREGSGADVRLRARGAGGGELVIDVADRGAGVPAGRREEVFHAFRQLGGGNGGVGLGLALAREIARAHGGDVRALGREDGPGALFELRLPLARGAAADDNPDGDAAAGAAGA